MHVPTPSLRGDIDAFVELTGVASLPQRFRDNARTAVRQRAERHEHPDAVAEALRQVPRSSAFDGLEQLDTLDLPVLVVGSRDDADPEHPLATAREYAERLPNAKLVVEDEGEPPLAWQGARLSRAISAFCLAAEGGLRAFLKRRTLFGETPASRPHQRSCPRVSPACGGGIRMCPRRVLETVRSRST